MDYFGMTEGDFVHCEYHWAQDIVCRAVDINHIDARGMGGNPSGDKDAIENLMAMCRDSHHRYGDNKNYKELLKKIHADYMKMYKK